jgi:hypothetical protein
MELGLPTLLVGELAGQGSNLQPPDPKDARCRPHDPSGAVACAFVDPIVRLVRVESLVPGGLPTNLPTNAFGGDRG